MFGPDRVGLGDDRLSWSVCLLLAGAGYGTTRVLSAFSARRLADRSTGPSEEERRTGRSRFWGEVRNAAGERRTARLETANGYRLTADGMIMAVKFLLEHAPAAATRRAC